MAERLDLDTLHGWLRATEAERFAHLTGRDMRTGRRTDVRPSTRPHTTPPREADRPERHHQMTHYIVGITVIDGTELHPMVNLGTSDPAAIHAALTDFLKTLATPGGIEKPAETVQERPGRAGGYLTMGPGLPEFVEGYSASMGLMAKKPEPEGQPGKAPAVPITAPGPSLAFRLGELRQLVRHWIASAPQRRIALEHLDALAAHLGDAR